MSKVLHIQSSPRGERSYSARAAEVFLEAYAKANPEDEIRTMSVFLACARGGAYGEGSGAEAYDLQVPYMRTILGFMGLTDVRVLEVKPTLAGGPEKSAEVFEAALEKSRDMAVDF